MTKHNNGEGVSNQVMNQPLFVRAKGKSFMSRWIEKCWVYFAILFIVMAILFSVFRALTPWATQYKGEVEHHLSSLLGQPVIISSMETSWYWFQPVLKLNQVALSDKHDHVLKLNKLLVGVDLFSSLLHWHIQPGILYLDDVHLTLRQKGQQWEIDGLRHDAHISTLDADAYLPILAWMLAQKKIIIKNFSALVHLDDGSLLPVSGLNLSATNHNGRYRLKGLAKLAQTTSTKLSILADMTLNPSALDQISGQAYFSAQQVIPSQWAHFFSKLRYHPDGGKADIKLWLDMKKGQLTGIQTHLNVHRIAWHKDLTNQPKFIQLLQANLAWSQTREGWQLSGDHINLRAEGIRWPENSFKLNYEKLPKSYHLFINELLLEPLLAIGIEWPDSMNPLLSIHPSGHLQGTQIRLTDGQVNDVLTHFSDLCFESSATFPAVKHLSGALHWQPTKGRLELDGESTTIAPTGVPPVTFEQLNAAFEWMPRAQGIRIKMDRLVLKHPNLNLSAQGVLNDPFSPVSRHLQLTADVFATNAAKWLAYIPSTMVKPKLDAWLKHNIKRIDKLRGQVIINGALADFPFDIKPGEFSIESRFSGMDLFFHKQWPLMSDIDTTIRLNKRSLEFDILHANLKNIPLEQANLRIDDLGKGKETLLIHGKFDVPADKMQAYIMDSPLKIRLEKLKKLDITGLLGLDLNLEIPLYPENDTVLVLGALTFNDNKIMLHHAMNDLSLRHLAGVLYFNEQGIKESELRARLLGGPAAIHMRSVRHPSLATELDIIGDTTIDFLRKKFNFPLFKVMQGHLNLVSRLTLTNDSTGFDHIQLKSSLKGVAIDLPVPFGKLAKDNAPLTIAADFNAEQAITLSMNYDERFKSNLWFTGSNGTFSLDKGLFKLGHGPVVWKNQSGVQLVGNLSNFNVDEWRDVLSRLSTTDATSDLFSNVQWIDMTLGVLTVGGKNYQSVGIKANKTGNDMWSFNLEQHDVAGYLNYRLSTNSLSGHLKRIYLAKSVWSKEQMMKPSTTLKPRDIPNLDLAIDVVKVGTFDLGRVDLKTNSSNRTFHIDHCNVISPTYRLGINGDWTQLGDKNNTNLQAVLQMSQLAETLERLNITPVINAKKTDIQFKGGWPGAINAFSLASLSGQMFMDIQDGRITHLSPETEEKLGFGKLLSILSLQTIPRRLKLDFSDLSQKGYSFDKLTGHLTLKNGVMSTTDSYIDGPVAYASMKGKLDLVDSRYDLDLHISPHITASLPIVATIAGGPVAGMAAWVASKIINQGMQTVTGYTYKITGPWHKPLVEQVSIFKKIQH